MKNLSQKFDSSFSDFNDFALAFQFLRDPFHFDTANSNKEIAILCLWINVGLKVICLLYTVWNTWKFGRVLQSWRCGNLFWLTRISQTFKSGFSKLLSLFGSTWTCESTFSSMGFIKSKYKCRIFYINLKAGMRCALSSHIQPTFMLIKFRIKFPDFQFEQFVSSFASEEIVTQ